MKRYRDAAGRLTMTIDEIAAATLAEAREYYQDGGRYIYEGRAYTLRRYIDRDAHENAVEVAQFVGIDGYNLFTDPARLGTFLPDVASDGQEITRFWPARRENGGGKDGDHQMQHYAAGR